MIAKGCYFSGSIIMTNNALYLFNRDLRVSNHPALYAASEAYNNLLPVYIVDPGLWEEGPQMSKRMSPLRYRFIMESLRDLWKSLQPYNSHLLVLKGDPISLLLQLRDSLNINTLCVQYEPDLYFQRLLQALTLRGLHVVQFKGDTLFQEPVYSLDSLPLTFTKYKYTSYKRSSYKQPASEVKIAPSPYYNEQQFYNVVKSEFHFAEYSPKSAVLFSGGETAAMNRIRRYMSREGGLFEYKETRNGMLGASYSSKLSAWLAHGCVAVSTVVSLIRDMESLYGANASTAAFLDELIWREFFRDQAEKQGHALYALGGIQNKRPGGSRNRDLLDLWKQGKTGNNFVDANMRELLQSGFMSNRGRQNVASFLIHNLGLDWRLGAAWFEEQLIDYDPYSNYCNWQYITGVGNSKNPRIFSIEKQAQRYDPNGDYVNYWLQ